jgi:DNA-binding SARP family transcriptional activator
VEFHVLGRLEVLDDGRDITPARPKQRALLALLLLRAGEVVTVDEAVDALWGEAPPPAARNALQGHVTALRKLLGPDRIETRAGYLLRLGDDELDLDRFERLVTDARDRPPEERAALLGEALALFRGEPLEDFRYETFARAEAAGSRSSDWPRARSESTPTSPSVGTTRSCPSWSASSPNSRCGSGSTGS